ncbi:tRNA methyltransferase [Leptolyngbya sp. BL0902]|uniref:tRNA (cytidine(34)-2'-O)-methyltransferase n=1 Tax=Leptolyngbya sp. BL0902 TaxID=1115757 RepID=UPI0018E8D212|nr:tRNA (cytidine(34)-2'-O)-methyltransferase [Leptolyngbya sp. BL0902]QQE63844.1 tRNA methyltransferase [Leptolyngbya sp. BL0902]
MPRLVLVHPQIPPNTGNIARTCAATNTHLHLVGPLGFDLSDRYLKRAGLDYWPHVNLTLHDQWASFAQHRQSLGGRTIAFSASGTCRYTDWAYQSEDWLLFGSETQGLPLAVMEQCTQVVSIPMNRQAVRSLNLSSSAAVGLFEALRQLDHWPSA